jgi:hypothetical protein
MKYRGGTVERFVGATGPLKPGESICVVKKDSRLYTVYRPPRRPDESPVAYYRRTGVVDDNFARRWHGWYYCNPAHCKSRWRSKAERDKHLDAAYAVLS